MFRLLNNNFFYLLFLIVGFRLFSLGLYPLTDTTEARYAEIARIMFETGDWITPYFDYDIPFWGKPPLSFWLTAISFKVFGVTEFAARFPSWLCGVVILWLLSISAKTLKLNNNYLSVVILASTMVFFVVLGGVMTEASLMLGIVLSMVSFIQVIYGNRARYWKYLFFVGLAVGMLAKGPIVIVLVITPLFFWAIVHKQYKQLWQDLPWITGGLLFLAISLPWYILAELKTPGFFDYFIVGEHFKRFLISGWQGDLYGVAHQEPHGTIWLFWVTAAFPWSLIFFYLLFSHIYNHHKSNALAFKESMVSLKSSFQLENIDYLLLYWSVFPMLFFTFSGNVIMTYIVPGMPAFSLLLAKYIEKLFSRKALTKTDNVPLQMFNTSVINFTGIITPLLILMIIIAGYYQPKLLNTEKNLINYLGSNTTKLPIYYLNEIEFSARFYSAGKAKKIDDTELSSLNDQSYYLAVRKDDAGSVAVRKLSAHSLVEDRRYILYKIN